MTLSEFLPYGGFAIAITALLINLFDRSKKRQDELRKEWKDADNEISKLLADISEEFDSMHSEIEVMKKQMEVFWKGVAYNSASLLHSPHTPELDILIERFTSGIINSDEMNRFREHLLHIASSKEEGSVRNYLARQVLLVLSVVPELQVTPIPYLIDYEIWKIKQRDTSL